MWTGGETIGPALLSTGDQTQVDTARKWRYSDPSEGGHAHADALQAKGFH